MPGLSLRLFQKGFVWWPSLLTTAIVGIHHFGRQCKEGQFIDGLFYASIARNQALGQGSFWKPYFSETFWLPYADGRVFYDNPPLVFGLEALGFRLLGDHWWVERLLGTLALLSLFLLLVKTLRLLFPGSSFRHHAWLPILLTYCFYQVRWGYANNVLETYLVLFDWGAVLCLLHPQAGRYRPAQRAGAALCLVLAFLTKGPAGLFPFVTPVLLGVFWPEKLPLKRALIETAWLVGLWGGGVGGMLLFEAPRRYLGHFWVHQVLDAVAGHREGIMGTLTQQRGLILGWLLTEIYRPLLLTAVVGFLGYRFNRVAFQRLRVMRTGLFFFALGFSASVPLAISAKQGYHYLLPCLPFFGLGMAVFFAPLLLALAPNQLPGVGRVLGVLVFFTGLCLLLSARTLVDYWRIQPKPYLSDFVYDMHQLSRHVPVGSYLTAPESTIRDGELLCYLQRYRRIALIRSTTPAVLLSTADSAQAHRWMVLGYRPIEAGLRTCVLLQKR